MPKASLPNLELSLGYLRGVRQFVWVPVVAGLVHACSGNSARHDSDSAQRSGASGALGSGGTTDGGNGGVAGSSSSTGGTPAAGGSSTAGSGSGGTSGSGAGGTAGGGGMNEGGSSAAGAGAGGSSAGTSAGSAGAAPTEDPLVFVGGSSEVRSYRFSPDTGVFTDASQSSMVGPNPSYFAVSQDRNVLLITNERDDSTGGITSTLILATGQMSPVNHITGPDGGFTFVALSPNGHHTLAASYNGGSVSVFNLGTDGIIGVELDNRDFGAGAQTHGVAFDPSGEHVFIPNKGNDEIAQLSIASDGKLTPNTPATVRTADGAGPRHIAMHPSGNLAFVINELDSTMVPYQVSATGTLTPGTAVSTLPSGFNGQNTGAHVEVSPDGKYVYGSNRGHDSIVAFSIDPTTGALALIEHEPSRGRTPRDFDMDPSGRFIVVANQQSSQLTALRIEADGKLTPLGDVVSGPAGAQAVQVVVSPP